MNSPTKPSSQARGYLIFGLIIALMIAGLFIAIMLDDTRSFMLDCAQELYLATGASESIWGEILSALIYDGIPVYVALLVLVAVAALVVFLLTRWILGRKSDRERSFFAHKDLALSKVAWLNALFIVLLALFLLASFSVFEMIFWGFSPKFFDTAGSEVDEIFRILDSARMPYNSYLRDIEQQLQSLHLHAGAYFMLSVGLSALLALVIMASFIGKSLILGRHTIAAMAQSLEATEITQTKNPRHKRLLNVIEEMALASSMPMPRVFVMEKESGINAMCSGERFGKADESFALFFTQGAISELSRDELSGVVGHEFSHAFHRDVALNLRIFSLVFAFMSISMIGESIMRAMAQSRTSSSSRDSGKGMAIIVAIALAFYALGFVGMLCAQLIQAAISRQKEFLADASSVQYTRNPNAILSALRKIQALESSLDVRAESKLDSKAKKATHPTHPTHPKQPGMLESAAAKPYAHMFFLRAFKGAFSTHPSLAKRIKRLSAMS